MKEKFILYKYAEFLRRNFNITLPSFMYDNFKIYNINKTHVQIIHKSQF